VDGSSSTASVGAGAKVLAPAFVIQVGSYVTLPHAVTFNLHWDDGTTSGDQPFTLTVGMGTGLSEGFESGLNGWTSGAVTSGVNEWHASATRAYGGSSTSIKAGSLVDPTSGASNDAKTYADNEDAALVSPMFLLPPNSQVTFQSWIDAETNGGTMCYDGGRVEISARGGPWVPVDVDGGYGQQIVFDSAASLRGSDVFSGSPQAWRRVVGDLSPYSGAVQIRFRFSTNAGNQPFDLNSGNLAASMKDGTWTRSRPPRARPRRRHGACSPSEAVRIPSACRTASPPPRRFASALRMDWRIPRSSRSCGSTIYADDWCAR